MLRNQRLYPLTGAYRRKDDKQAIRADIEKMYALFPRLAERRNQDATTNAQIGLAQKYNRIVTTLDGLKKAVSEGDDLVS